MNPRGYSYARLSHAERAGKVMTLAEQHKINRRAAKARGTDIVGQFEDDGISAWDEEKARNRPGFSALVAAIGEGEVDVVFAVAQDRISRRSELMGAFNSLCARHGVVLVFDGREIDPANDAHARGMSGIEAAISEMESTIKSARILRAREVSAREGRPHGGRRPFGWNADRLTLHPVEAPAYRRMFDLAIAGHGMTRIAWLLEAEGILNGRGERFDSSAVQAMLRSPRAIGARVHRGEVVEGVTGTWEPIVTPEVQVAALAAMRGRRRLRVTGPQRAPRLLSSLAVCAVCEQNLRLRHQLGQPVYVCEKSKSRCCGQTQVVAELAEVEVEKRLLSELCKPKTHKALERLRTRKPDVGRLLDEIQRLEDDLAGYTLDAKQGRMRRTAYLDIAGGLEGQIKVLKDKLSTATEVPLMLTMRPQDVLDAWATYDVDERRRVLGAWIKRVVVSPGALGRDPSKRFRVLWNF